MSDKIFQQELKDDNAFHYGGPFIIQMLFKEPVDMPDKEKMTAVIAKHIGPIECFCHDKQTAGFAALEHIAEFKDGKDRCSSWSWDAAALREKDSMISS